MEIFTRTKLLIGDNALKKLQSSHVVICGCGGVGSYSLEALVRAGIGKITVIDSDRIDESNINRQIIATSQTIGILKTEAAKTRALSINPKIIFTGINAFLDTDNTKDLISKDADFIIDAVDFVPAKKAIALFSQSTSIPLISCLGTGNRTDATKFEICDIYKTDTCPLARKMRYELRRAGVKKLTVLYSKAKAVSPVYNNDASQHTVGSISYVPSVAGLLIAQHVITTLTGDTNI